MTLSRNQPHRAIETSNAPAPVGPYSQAVVWGDLVLASGQIPLDPATGQRVSDEIETQVQQVLANLSAVLEAAGSSLDSVLKTTVFLTDLALFPKVNALYAEAFNGDPAPARSTVEVSALPLGALVEIEAIARIPAAP
ncbi:MAG: Rid family detoxifying hydrolase [Myxococcota bacterium]|nr:Rid family detoxifying hydrolase [Myxococcota bacterium]